MSLVSGAASYKKKAGVVTIFEDRTPSVLQWRAADDPTVVEFVLSTITHLQATPATSEKMMLKIITKRGEEEPVNYVFSFNNRLVMDNVKEALQQIVARHKTAVQAAQSQSATPAPEKPLINTTFLDEALDSRKLLKNHQLQQKLLLENKDLMATFKEAVMNQGLDPAEFWTTRVHLLRAFALTNSQKKGPYNVLSTIKTTATSDNQVNVSVTREKIHVIFEQYPVVRKAYDDNVPRLSEGEFWSRFFSSKLLIKLKGEKIATNLRGDVILDKYINMDLDYEKHEDETIDHKVNKTIDIQGNEEDDPSKKGNAPDMTMKPDAIPETVSALRSMNRLSHKMMNSLELEYSRQATPDLQKTREKEELERIRRELIFNDLEPPQNTEYAEISLKHDIEQQIQKKRPVTKQEYVTYTADLKHQLDDDFDLTQVYSQAKRPQIEMAAQEILKSVKMNSKQSKQSWQVYKSFEEQQTHQAHDELDPTFNTQLLESLRITHATSVEFLRHFWLHFNSGDPSQASNVNNLYNSLLKSLERVKGAIEEIKDDRSKNLAQAHFAPLKQSLEVAISKYQDEVQTATATYIL
jgi:transcription initiation factor TFIIH subunit 1